MGRKINVLYCLVVAGGLHCVAGGCKKQESGSVPAAVPAAPVVSTPPPKAKPTLSDDPAASFEAYSQKYVARARHLCEATATPEFRLSWSDETPVKIDVQKTDSLMSPFVGTVSSKITNVCKVTGAIKEANGSDTVYVDMNVQVTFGAQNGKWVLTSLRATNIELGSDASGVVGDVLRAATDVPQ